MTEQQRHDIQYLIPDILPLDHVSLSAKRIRFIRGQGVILYNDTFAVELYTPFNSEEEPVFFGVQRHHDRIEELGSYFRKLKVQNYDDPSTSAILKQKFDEALFQYDPPRLSEKKWILPNAIKKNNELHEAVEIYMRENLSGAA